MKHLLQTIQKWISNFYLALILVFLYAPILTMMVLSFNTSKSRSQWGGFTLDWYVQMFQSSSIMNALYVTLLIALVSALAATILGTAAAIAMNSMSRVPRSFCMGLTNIPMLNAEIVTAISLMLSYIAFGISLGFKTVLIAHITFNLPYVILSVMPKLKQTDRTIYEAAMDLGASPIEAFFKVVFPDILPGVVSGFLLAFTMSLDDFIITHFTKGAGINTLSTLIYSEVRRGIRPSMYALSTVIFLAVLAILLVANFRPAPKPGKPQKQPLLDKMLTKKMLPLTGAACLILAGLIIVPGYKAVFASNTAGSTLKVYNWGEYIDEDVIKQFEEETGITVIYDTFETNEEMYPVIEAGGVKYDVVCPSDYMIQHMIEKNLLAPLDTGNIPNISQIGDSYLKMAESFDPGNQYAVPYTWGTVGILYNKQRLEELGVPAPTQWSDLWDPRLKGEILMQNSVRDCFMVALKSLGYSLNSTNPDELEQATKLLIEQKPLVQAYVVDQARDKMISGEAAVSVIFSGELLYIQEQIESLGLGYDLEYVVPENGSNVWIDAWVIPANAENKEAAEKWIDFLCRPDIALKNFEYITYSTPNTGAFEMLDPELQENKAVFPDMNALLRESETFQYLGETSERLYNELWKQVKAAK